jgi:Protein of unknown function (DUF3618)
MDSTPDDIRSRIAATRASLDRHLGELGTQVDVTKDRVATNAQYWGGITAVVAGMVGAVVMWPRRAPRRRVLHSFQGADVPAEM